MKRLSLSRVFIVEARQLRDKGSAVERFEVRALRGHMAARAVTAARPDLKVVSVARKGAEA